MTANDVNITSQKQLEVLLYQLARGIISASVKLLSLQLTRKYDSFLRLTDIRFFAELEHERRRIE